MPLPLPKDETDDEDEMRDANNRLGLSGGSSWMSKYLIDPRESKYHATWDMISAVALIFVAIVTDGM